MKGIPCSFIMVPGRGQLGHGLPSKIIRVLDWRLSQVSSLSDTQLTLVAPCEGCLYQTHFCQGLWSKPGFF